VTIEGQANSQSQTVSYALTIQLSTNTECTCFIDASARNHRLIVLAFVSENDAQTLLKLIQAGSSTTARGGRLSISQGVVLPQQLSEDEPVTPSTDNDQDLSKTTSGAVSFKAQNPPPVTMQPRSQSQSLTTSNKESVTDPLDFRQAKPSTHEMPSRTSISLGVNVSQTNSTNHDIMCNQLCSKAGDEGYKDPCHPDTAENAQDSLPYVSRIAPNTKSSSLLRQPTEVESLKDVAETHNNPNFPGNQSSAILQGLQHGMEDHGSSHEAVFGTYKDVFRSSTNEVLPPGSSPIPGHGLHISAQANLETIVTNDEAPSKLHAVSLNRALQATQVKNASKFNTAHQPSRNTSPEKLKWSFRGGRESKREVSAENEPKQSEDISPQLMKKAERGRKEKPIELTKTKVRTQKELRSIKKPLAPGIRSGPAATQLSDGVDEYEVQDSPSNLNRSRPAARAKQRKTNGTGAEAVTKSQRDPNFVSTAKITRRKSTKGIDQDKELLSKEGHRLDDQSSQAQFNEPVEPVRNRQTDKQRQTLKKPKAVAQPTLAATIRPRPRREAARKANARIQGLEIGSKSTSIDEQRAKAREQSIIETLNAGTDINGLSIGSNDRAAKGKSVALAAVAKLGARKPGILKAHTKSSSSPRKPEPSNDSISKSSLGIDNSDQVDLIGGQDSENANDSHEGAQSSDVKAADPPEVQNRGPEMLEDEFIVKKSTLSAKEQDSALNQMAGAADHIHLPDIVPKIKDVIDETETNITARPIMDSLGRPLQQIMVGDAEDSYFQAAINDMEGGSKQLGRQRVAMSNFDIDTHGEDPFGTRLGLLLPPSRVANDRLGYIEPQNTRSVPETQDFLNAKVQKILNSLPTVTKTKISNAQTPDNLAAPAVNDSRLAQDESRATRLSQPSSAGKRRLEEGESELKKRLKLTPLRENGAITERQGLHENSSAKTPVPVISKKPGLISWNSSGPRNQGATSAKKPKPHQTVKAVALIVQTSGERHELKRKTIDDQGPRQRDQPAKRQRRDFVTPRQSRMYVPQMIAEPDSSAKQDKGHRLSSQSMKVDENGSPLPLAQPRIDHHEPEEKLDDDLLASNDNEIVSNNDDGDNYDVHTPRLPTKQDTVQRTEENLKPMKMIRNSKQQPSSPRAPSAIGTDEPHTILNSGEMVNNETLESILPTLPQDPFVGGPEKPPGSFVKLLRKSSGVEARRESDQANLANSSRGVKRRSIDSDDDPDKTLVEPEREPKRKRQKGNSHSATESSPTTRSTSKDESVVGEQSDDENSYEVRRWLKTLEPHQANMLDILTIITHVSISPYALTSSS